MKTATKILAIAFLSVAQQCTGPMNTAGGSTSTDNAKVSAVVVHADGSPVSGAMVRCRPADYLSDGTADAIADSYTDGSGRFSIDSIDSGNYCIEIADNNGNGVAISCSIPGKSPVNLGTHTIVAMGMIVGTAGGPAVKAHLRVRGLDRYVPADSGGRFCTMVPSGRSYSVNITAPDTSVDLPLTTPVEPSRSVAVAADLGNYATDSIAVRLFINSMNMSAVPLDSIMRIGDGKRIRTLFLRGRNLSSIPASIGNLTFLWEIDAGANPLDSLPHTIEDLPLLSHLFLDRTPLRKLPEAVCRCLGLKWLKCSNSGIRDLPPALVSLTRLNVLDMSGDSLDSVPSILFRLTSLRELSLARNHLTHIPASIGECPSLEILHLDDNILDSLPDAIAGLSRLRIIYAYRNNLTYLPDSIGKLEKLERLELQENRLSAIPASIGSCISINYLNVWGNDLTGLPASIVNVKPVDGLTLGGNRLCDLDSTVAAWADTFAESSWRETQDCL